MATRLIVPEEPVRPATVGISQQMQLEFAAGVTDLDDKPAVILVCVRVGHGLLRWDRWFECLCLQRRVRNEPSGASQGPLRR